MTGSVAYWIVVGVIIAGIAIGHTAYRNNLKRKGYWIRDGDSMLAPILIVVILVAIALPSVWNR